MLCVNDEKKTKRHRFTFHLEYIDLYGGNYDCEAETTEEAVEKLERDFPGAYGCVKSMSFVN